MLLKLISPLFTFLLRLLRTFQIMYVVFIILLLDVDDTEFAVENQERKPQL